MKQVLFVDDERSVLSALERMLRPHGHRWNMRFAQSATEALATFETQTVDILVTDLRMPGMDGAALLDIVRAQHPETVRIIMSAESEDVDAIGATVYLILHKPCEPHEIVDALDRAGRTPAD